MLRSALRKLSRTLTSTTRRPARPMTRRAALQVEGLEDRLVLSTTNPLPTFVTNELNALQTSIDQHLFGKALPLVGTALNQVGGSIVASFKQALIDGAQAAIGGNMQAVQAAITKDLGKPGAGSILQGITTTSGSKGDFTAELHLKDSSVLSTGKVDLNLGLPGLPIQFAAHNAAVNVQAGYDVVLDFGMQGGSPFLKTKADPKNTANPLGVALNISAQVAPGSSISATLGGLTATLTQPTTLLTSPVNANLVRLGTGGIILPVPTAPPSTFAATLDFGFSVGTNGGIQLVTPQLTGAANVNLQAALTLGDNPTLPSITAGLNVNWTFNSADPTQSGLLGNAPTVSFNNVTVDLGSFLSNVVRPVVTAVQQYTQPLERVAQMLTAPLPGITDVTNALGMQPITVAGLLGGGSGSSLTTFANTIQFINGLQVPASGSIKVNVGSFNVTDARKANSQATNFAETAAVKQNGLLGAAGGQSTYTNLQGHADFHFPMLDNPVGFVSSVLLGQPVNLVTANLGVDFSAGFNVNVPFFGIPDIASLNVNFFGSVSVDAGATFVLTDAFLLGGPLLNSLQVQNAHMDASLTVGAGAGASLLGFSASLDGTVGVTFDVGMTNKTTGSTTFTGSDLLDGNVSLNVTSSQLQAAVKFEVDAPFGITLYSVSDPLFNVNLLTGATSIVGGGGGGGGPIGNGGGHHELN